MFRFGASPARRRPPMTPMIDIVFLLLIFFMLASHFGQTTAVPLNTAGAGVYNGPPRLIDVAPDTLRLNGRVIDVALLAEALAPLVFAPDDAIVVRADEETDLGRLVEVLDALQAAGFSTLQLVE